jgi:soluble lytic murein transglycosylase-like protein
MSNWFSLYHIKQHTQYPHKKRNVLMYGLFSMVLIIIGSWMILSLLSAQGIHLLSTADHQPVDFIEQRLFSPSVMYWQNQIEDWAEAYNLDPRLIATVMQIESCGDPAAISSAGAQGLFQVMPYHFQPGEDMLDPQTNAQRGLSYLVESLLKSNGNIELALAGYNGGHSQISRHPTLWPDETQRYVHWGSSIYRDAINDNPQEKALSAWLQAGGWRLCQAAESRLSLP